MAGAAQDARTGASGWQPKKKKSSSVHYAMKERDDRFERQYSLERRKNLKEALEQASELIGGEAGQDSTLVKRWQRTGVPRQGEGDGEAGVPARDLRMVAGPLSVAYVGEVTGFKNVPKANPTVKAVIPPWNYEKQENTYVQNKLASQRDLLVAASKGVRAESYRAKRRERALMRSQSLRTPEVQMTRELKQKIGALDKKLRKMEEPAHRHHARRPPNDTTPRSAHAGSVSHVAAQNADTKAIRESYPRSAVGAKSDLRAFNFALSAYNEHPPREQDEFTKEMQAQVRHLNTRIRELLNNSTHQCARELKETFRDLLDEELASIDQCGSMRQDTKMKLRRYVKAMVMRRVDVEIEKRRLFEWPEEGVQKYAKDVIRAEEERRRVEERMARLKAHREAKVHRAAAVMPAIASATQKMLKVRKHSETGDGASTPSKENDKRGGSVFGSSRNTSLSKGAVGGGRKPGTPLGVVLGEERRVSSRGEGSESNPSNLGTEDREPAGGSEPIAETTAHVAQMLAGLAPVDPEYLSQVITLRLAGELIGRPYCTALQSVLQRCPRLRVLELPRNDLGATNFHGIMDAMCRADTLPIEVLDLSANCLGADGGASVPALATYLRRPATSPTPTAHGHRLRVLRLRACMLNDKGIKALAIALPEVQTLRELDLSENQISDIGAKALSEALSKGSNKRLRKLSFAYNDLGPMGTSWVAALLEKGAANKLRELDLSWNQRMGQAGLEILVLSLHTNTNLAVLHLRACELTDEAMDVVALLSLLNKTLETLHLERNNFTAHGKRQLLQSLGNQTVKPTKNKDPKEAEPGCRGVELTLDALRQRIAAQQTVYTTPLVVSKTKRNRGGAPTPTAVTEAVDGAGAALPVSSRSAVADAKSGAGVEKADKDAISHLACMPSLLYQVTRDVAEANTEPQGTTPSRR